MIPQVMSATQSVLSMTECYAVFMQFEELNEVNVQLSIAFGFLTFVCSFLGIFYVNQFIKKSGRQSIIAVILTVVLCLSLAVMPVKLII